MAEKCLIIDDDRLDRKNFAQILKDMGLEYDEAADSKDGFKKIQNFKYDLVLLDIVMPDFNQRQSKNGGIALLKLIEEQHPGLPVIIISALEKKKGKEEEWLSKFQIADYIVKGDKSTEEIQRVVAKALRKSKSEE